MYTKSYSRTPCLDIAIINMRYQFVPFVFVKILTICMKEIYFYSTRRDIIFVRIWDRHVTRHITSWKPAEHGMWTLAATLLKVNWTEGDVFVLIFKSYLIYMFQSNNKITGGLATTYESQIAFRPHNQPSYELEASRAALHAARGSLSRQVKQAVNLRNRVANNVNLHVSTL